MKTGMQQTVHIFSDLCKNLLFIDEQKYKQKKTKKEPLKYMLHRAVKAVFTNPNAYINTTKKKI